MLFNVRFNSASEHLYYCPVLAMDERLYAAPIPCGARIDLALESAL